MQLPKAPGALCSVCPFKDRAFAPSSGPVDAKFAVVSRSPGYYEALNGKSFSGPSGKVLDHLLHLHGVRRDEVLVTNTVLCQSDGQDKGFGMALSCCSERLQGEISHAETIIAAGREASWSVIGEANIGANRGFVHYRESEVTGKKQRVIVTNNPAVVVRDDASFPELVRDFKLAINPITEPKLPYVKWTEDIDEARAWIPQLQDAFKAGILIASDIEGGHPLLACAGFAIRSERAVVFGYPVVQAILSELASLWEVSGVNYLWHSGKYDTKVLRRFGIQARTDEDSLLLSYALDERPGNPESGAGGHSLEWLLKDFLGWPRYEPPTVKQFKSYMRKGELAKAEEWLKSKRNRIDLYEYNGMDTAGCLTLYHVLKEAAILDNVYERPYKSQLLNVNRALLEVELQGNLFDAEECCNILEEKVWPTLYDWRRELREISKIEKLNPNSPPQMASLLYDDWGLRHALRRPKIEARDKRSTDKMVRDTILHDNFHVADHVDRIGFVEFIKKYDKFKELDKQRGTYLEGLVLRRASNGRIYTEYKIHGTESGRLSSANPNMQNVTRPKEGLPNIRRVFIPDPGCVFISGDLSQAELRTIAVLSGDKELQAIYLDTDRSLHKEVAAQFYGENYTYEQYVRSKNINFGVAYWQSAFSFAQMYHMPEREAQDYIDFWWERFPDVWDWTKKMESEVLNVGEIQSPFGHKRRFYVIPQDQGARIHIVKEGINFKPQNIAANITLYALCELVDILDPDIAQVRITVHDSIVINSRISHQEEVADVVKSTMESAAKRSIGWEFPFATDISIGDTWGTLIEYNRPRTMEQIQNN